MRSVELCSFACKEDFSDNANEACQAFSISSAGECEFGTIDADACLGVLDQSAPNYVQVYADIAKYESFKG